jgi:hypothetical protein
MGLSEIIDEIKDRTIQVAKEFESETERDILKVIMRRVRNAVCFDMGKMENLEGFCEVKSLVRLPYPTCWFEGSYRGQLDHYRRGFLCFEDVLNNKKVLASCHLVRPLNHARKWIITACSIYYNEPQDKYRLEIRGPESGSERGKYESEWHLCLRVFLSVLNCSNIIRREHLPPRAMRRHPGTGHPPFSWWTLHVNLPKENIEKESMGGCHASPRVHLRRGHIRQYEAGKWCWVRDSVVGAKKSGLIHKEYGISFRTGQSSDSSFQHCIE